MPKVSKSKRNVRGRVKNSFGHASPRTVSSALLTTLSYASCTCWAEFWAEQTALHTLRTQRHALKTIPVMPPQSGAPTPERRQSDSRTASPAGSSGDAAKLTAAVAADTALAAGDALKPEPKPEPVPPTAVTATEPGVDAADDTPVLQV